MSSSSALGQGKIRVWCVFYVCNLIVINEPKGGEYLIKHELNIKQGVAGGGAIWCCIVSSLGRTWWTFALQMARGHVNDDKGWCQDGQ